MNSTTRSYPRTTQEAFKDADYAISIEGYSENPKMTFLDYIIIVLSLTISSCILAYVLL
jgi:hypothetical protein